MKLSEVIKMIY